MKLDNILYKIMIIIGLYLIAYYFINSTTYNDKFQQSIHKIINHGSTFVGSMTHFIYKLWSKIQKQIEIYFPLKKTVIIQELSPDQEDFYNDTNTCLPGPGLENCLKNQEFFSETYFGYGDKNIDPVLNNDYSNDPIN